MSSDGLPTTPADVKARQDQAVQDAALAVVRSALAVLTVIGHRSHACELAAAADVARRDMDRLWEAASHACE